MTIRPVAYTLITPISKGFTVLSSDHEALNGRDPLKCQFLGEVAVYMRTGSLSDAVWTKNIIHIEESVGN